MTKIIYDTDTLSITMIGHAGAGEYGHDLVCAALSILKHVLQMSLHEAEITEDDGFFNVVAPPTPENIAIADAIGNGFSLLSKSEFVKFESHGLKP